MIELTPDQQSFVESQIAIGAYDAPSEVVGAALELLRREAERREREETAASIGRGLADADAGRTEAAASVIAGLRRGLTAE